MILRHWPSSSPRALTWPKKSWQRQDCAAATIRLHVRHSIATDSSSSRQTLKQARDITNRLAPEHLTVDAASDLEWVRNAGSVFVGRWSAQPMGDYISGPNHTLPTGGMAHVRGGLSVNDFVKLITVQEYAPQGMRTLGPQAALLAQGRGSYRPRRVDSISLKQQLEQKEPT